MNLDIRYFGLPDLGMQWKLRSGLAADRLWRVDVDGRLLSRSPQAIPEYPWLHEPKSCKVRIFAHARVGNTFRHYDFELDFVCGQVSQVSMWENGDGRVFHTPQVVWSRNYSAEILDPSRSVMESLKMTCKCGEPADIHIVGKKYRCAKCARKIANRILENVGDK